MTTSPPFTPEKPLRLGTRGSKMALIQAEQVKQRLIEAHPYLAAPGAVQLVVLATTGDKVRDRRLSEVGGKGMFIKELEIALEDNQVDAAVHSMKDVPSLLLAPFSIAAIMERDAPWDVFISRTAKTLADLPHGATLGTSAPRREALTLAQRPDLKVVLFRGNADTRLEKLARGEVDATYLSLSGLQRIDRFETQFKVLSPEEMLPAAGQGAIGVEIMTHNTLLGDMLQAINHIPSYQAVTAERACLAELCGDCHSPLAAYAHIQGEELHLTALAARPDGTQIIQYSDKAPLENYLSLGIHVGDTIKKQLPEDFFGICEAA
ncbi:MAG: hydroxymethylbilane synthase [Alphaproteobacteria bacterium]|nr:hydroxymethylbilane synthase [Alphaproteobacteria bacterium]